MATENRVSCDVCGAQKRSVNHWWKIKEMASHVRVYRASETVPRPYKDVCGQSCAHRLMDKWMELSFEDQVKGERDEEN